MFSNSVRMYVGAKLVGGRSQMMWWRCVCVIRNTFKERKTECLCVFFLVKRYSSLQGDEMCEQEGNVATLQAESDELPV